MAGLIKKNTGDVPRNRFAAKTVSTFVLLAALLLFGCTVGPKYHRPVVQTPSVFHDPSESEQAQAQLASFGDLPWWQVFQDPYLQDLIRTAFKQNYDLQLAVERVTAARARVGIVRSNEFPQVTVNPDFSGGKTRAPSPTFSCSLPTLFFKSTNEMVPRCTLR
jgi:outer membrane protein, multidrug efflux system